MRVRYACCRAKEMKNGSFGDAVSSPQLKVVDLLFPNKLIGVFFIDVQHPAELRNGYNIRETSEHRFIEIILLLFSIPRRRNTPARTAHPAT